MKSGEPSEFRVLVVAPCTSIHDTILRLAQKRSAGMVEGMAVVAAAGGEVLGVVTDGDIRRAYAAKVDFALPVETIMVKDPVSLPHGTRQAEMLPELIRRVRSTKRLRSIVRHALVVDEGNRLKDVIDVTDLLLKATHGSQNVAVYGMGHVGVTLAVTLANFGHNVAGIELDASVMEELNAGRSRIHEPGLADMLAVVRRAGRFAVRPAPDGQAHGVHIVAVGSPVDAEGVADETALMSVAASVATVLKRGDLVMLRSTVPVGFTRRRFIPRLEQLSGLRAGDEFHVAFAPERTVEGKALVELRTLPQVVGGLGEACVERAASFWATVTPSVVRADSLEAAEIIKVANNTYRDLCFAFANELALLSDVYNLNAARVIRAANDGYPRNPIPLPSPGVGGYCLTKDPLLYGQPHGDGGFRPVLGSRGRAVNEKARDYPVDILGRWARSRGRSMRDLRVLLVGMAFKGVPETADMRQSTALDNARALQGLVGEVRVWDAIVKPAALENLGFTFAAQVAEEMARADAILLLNNHPVHPTLGLTRALAENPRERLVFDGWNQLDSREIEQIPGAAYATMGYMTPLRAR
jgi:UDP-N-acetyl-D-mannosaminuronic acid dehydrogenase